MYIFCYLYIHTYIAHDWAPREYNALPNYLCNQWLKHQVSFHWVLKPFPILSKLNLIFRTDGGRWEGTGSASSWILIGAVGNANLEVLAFSADYTTEPETVFLSELKAILKASIFLNEVLTVSPSNEFSDPSFLAGSCRDWGKRSQERDPFDL